MHGFDRLQNYFLLNELFVDAIDAIFFQLSDSIEEYSTEIDCIPSIELHIFFW